MTANANNNFTTLDIIDTINDIFDGDVMDFVTSFIRYCNDRTFFGVPRKCAPLDDDVVSGFDARMFWVSDAASNYYVACAYEFEQLIDSKSDYDVYVTMYMHDEEYNEVYPCTGYVPQFNVSNPADLVQLCRYIGVTFQLNYFDE